MSSFPVGRPEKNDQRLQRGVGLTQSDTLAIPTPLHGSTKAAQLIFDVKADPEIGVPAQVLKPEVSSPKGPLQPLQNNRSHFGVPANGKIHFCLGASYG